MRWCITCRQKADLSFRSPRVAFCREHFQQHFVRQVERAIRKFNMLEPGQPVLLAVSGGSDSLACWDALLALGYPATGVHLDLGLGDHSTDSLEACRKFAEQHRAELYVLSIPGSYGAGMEEIVR
ncbi:MAG: tRNA(Ile)-lysidine synthetase, partial [Thermoleophilia bacterium]|nr:tRNA(Ile)-lysidine synthetase [Thermoleophilia bacterium]